ncbi:hypothetical protein PF005_g24400 [Phytophthora fragariae]|uniref:RxLR effector protein n=1 Tax=Phytophthora fragariae TaxID=53985 RepID=A0A6A3RA40_9STRA|nr:hypothetical protein PF003_g30394 [Phytophthora fragariae]KAE8924901.1 hypothetical protein PF009_g24876 [Phytophthora fragariae]KAE8991077.1 hypothetical protein PF011_g18089 [Phytophthora fragariae]KAE9086956.1 hypothetical protein PF010_g19905 [Phytophthora fragariae]KAE9092271.1 hypothetical protein PF007_g18579 [Phytophthora fragariae]
MGLRVLLSAAIAACLCGVSITTRCSRSRSSSTSPGWRRPPSSSAVKLALFWITKKGRRQVVLPWLWCATPPVPVLCCQARRVES